MKKFSSAVLTALMIPFLSAVEHGGSISIDALKKKAEPIVEIKAPAAPSPKKKEKPYEIILFYDATARDAASSLAILDDMSFRWNDMPADEKPVILALSRNSKRLTKASLGADGVQIQVYADEKRVLFNEYAVDDIILPFALIVKDGKVVWKGSVIDVENIYSLIRQKKFNAESQVKVERIRREMQMAIQASLPDVVLRSAEDILKYQKGDAMAIRAKLFVLESTKRFPQALAFAKQNAEENPEDVNQTLLYFEYLNRAGDVQKFSPAFTDGLKRFKDSPEHLFRILNYAAFALPFTWMPPAEASAAAETIRPYWIKQAPARRARFHETMARIRYLLCDPAGAVREQTAAMENRKGHSLEADTRRMLNYYRSIPVKK